MFSLLIRPTTRLPLTRQSLSSTSLRFKSTMPTPTTKLPYIITPTELSTFLAAQQSHPDPHHRIIPISAEWYLPNNPLNGYTEFTKRHIPESRYFDVDAVKDATSPYPHMLPDAATFSKACSELGIKKTDTLVFYDSPHIGIFSAPRAAWTFKLFGHEKVHLLNNFKLWVEAGLPTVAGEGKDWEKTSYGEVKLDRGKVVGFEEMVKLVEERKMTEGVEIMDARPVGRFWGEEPEPRKRLVVGMRRVSFVFRSWGWGDTDGGGRRDFDAVYGVVGSGE